ncbi:MAG: hypothetical protein F6K35_08785 [Okeania sp. SIO2H7]|nr:hypothetical protein [Okeania sp. SIO2H7]
MSRLKKTTQEEAKGIVTFLQLPLDLQGKLWHLLTKRSQLTISILECLCNGPKTYKEIAELLDIPTPTLRTYCSAYLKPFPVKLGYRTQMSKNGKLNYHRTLHLVNLKLINSQANVKRDRAS